MVNPILKNIPVLLCTKCRASSWTDTSDAITCNSCGNKYEINDNNKLITTEGFFEEQKWEEVSKGFNLFKGNVKVTSVDKLGGPRIKNLRKDLGVEALL
jgi:uncharacterized protein YbaR (Trm112 family)